MHRYLNKRQLEISEHDCELRTTVDHSKSENVEDRVIESAIALDDYHRTKRIRAANAANTRIFDNQNFRPSQV